MNDAGVHRAILIPPSWEGYRNDLVLHAATTYPDRFAAMARLDIEGEGALRELMELRDEPGILGVRMLFETPQKRVWLEDGTAERFWSAAERRGIPVMVYLPATPEAVDNIAIRHPELKIIIDHFGLPVSAKDTMLRPIVQGYLTLSRHPNVAMKASSLPYFTTEPYPFPTLQALVEEVVNAFGSDRVFWGSDLTHLQWTYRQAVTFFTEEMPFLAGSDLDNVMGAALCRWLGWQ